MQQLGADTDKSILLCDDDNDLSARPASDFAVLTTADIPPQGQVAARPRRERSHEPCALASTLVRWPADLSMKRFKQRDRAELAEEVGSVFVVSNSSPSIAEAAAADPDKFGSRRRAAFWPRTKFCMRWATSSAHTSSASRG